MVEVVASDYARHRGERVAEISADAVRYYGFCMSAFPPAGRIPTMDQTPPQEL